MAAAGQGPNDSWSIPDPPSRIFEYQAALLYAKTLVVDGTWATIGSTNFDNRSFAVNDELNLAVYDTPLGGRIAKSFEEDLAHATRVTYESGKNRGLRPNYSSFRLPSRVTALIDDPLPVPRGSESGLLER